MLIRKSSAGTYWRPVTDSEIAGAACEYCGKHVAESKTNASARIALLIRKPIQSGSVNLEIGQLISNRYSIILNESGPLRTAKSPQELAVEITTQLLAAPAKQSETETGGEC